MTTAKEFDSLPAKTQEDRLTAFAVIALEQWDGDWRPVRLIKYRENAVFEVVSSAGLRAALRVHRPGYHSVVELRSELTWMNALSDDGVALPRPITARNGSLLAEVEMIGVPYPRQVDMFTWVEGVPLSSVTDPLSLAENYREVGSLVAAIHRHAGSWQPPRDFRRHAWDTDGLIGPHALWGDYSKLEVLTADDRELFDRASRVAAAELRRLPATEYCLIHADLVPDNIMLCADGVKVIDFDDAGYGWRMFEIATALFHYLGEAHYSEIEQAFFEGYRSVFAVSEKELATLPLFFFLRGLTYLSWVHTRSGTETARAMTPVFVQRTRMQAQAYLKGR